MKKFNEQLLSLTPEVRLGTSYAQLKANKFFDEIDWDLLYDRKLKGPVLNIFYFSIYLRTKSSSKRNTSINPSNKIKVFGMRCTHDTSRIVKK